MSETTRAPASNGERQPLLANGNGENAGSLEKKHYNLAGLSPVAFWTLCISMWLAALLVAFDTTVVATLLGPISSSFNATNQASWLGTSYLLAVCCISPIYGRLCNVIGRQASMLISVGIFAVGNMACAAAPTMNALIGARFVAGLGGGGLQVTSSTIMSDIVPISYRGIFQGCANILFGIGVASGAPVGGFLNDWLGWRWAFWMQGPTFVVAFIAVFFFVRYTVPESRKVAQTPMEMLRRIDFFGSILLFGWMGCALLAVSLKTESTDDDVRWTDPTIIALFSAAAALFVIFMIFELKVAREPVLPVELLSRITPIAVALENFLWSASLFATLYSVPLFFTAVRQMPAAAAGRHLMHIPLIGMFCSLGAGFYVKKYNKYKWLNFVGGLDGILSAILLSTWSVESPEWTLWTYYAVGAPSGSLITTLTLVALIADAGRDGIAMATSLSYVARMTGQVVGAAMGGAIIQTVLRKELNARITGPDSAELISTIRKSSAAINTLPPAAKAAAIISYQNAIHAVFVSTIILAIVYTFIGLFIKEVDLNSPKESQAPTPQNEPESRQEEA